ncbi:MAG: primosomal protein N' [Oscillospiraceae bacterium]|nr:primosomal protein N' [Oscillospiraceae bacterium]
MIARVALADLGYAIDKLYDYSVPAALTAQAEAGKRVSVPFARGNRRQEGMVMELTEHSDFGELKSIDAWLDETPLLTPKQLELARWMKKRFFCTFYDAVKAMLPAGVWIKSECVCRMCTDAESALAAAEGDEAASAVISFLAGHGGAAELTKLKELLGADAAEAVSRLEKAGTGRREMEGRRKLTEKSDHIARLLISGEEALAEADRKTRRAPQQAELLRILASFGEASVKELRYYTGAPLQSVRALRQSGYIEIIKRTAYKRPDFTPTDKPVITALSKEPQAAYEGIRELMRAPKASAALLYGVTGSGKTAVYIRLIGDVIAAGGRAITLVPEIALTPQLMDVFYRHFGDRVAVLHSSLTTRERYDEWRRIKDGKVDVVVGTRSAVFAPVEKLGLLIIDEEQEYTYKSENAPRYHAREVAKYRCVESGALLLLGSATPSVESMYNARTGKYSLFRMTGRYNTMPLPKVMTADMKQELRDGNGTDISRMLLRELRENISRGEQSILLINRRGSSSAVTCPECGYVFSCPKCSAKLTYHSANGRMMCHYCGYSETAVKACPECSGILSYGGVGTQKVEEELRRALDGAEIIRMDTDTVSAANTHEAILGRFEKERTPVLIGTQMVAKGLDFENVTLVGVINADQSLYSGDYRAGERTFSLITQVVGRAGRGGKEGRAVIQTLTPDNPVIQCAAKQDYDSFYENEIKLRQILRAPPVMELYCITVSGTEEHKVLQCAGELAASLERSTHFRVLGPAPATVLKVNDRYRYRVTVNADPSGEIRAVIAAAIKKYSSDKRFRDLSLHGDTDPTE